VSPEKIHQHKLISDEPYMQFLVVVLAAVLLVPATVLCMIWLLIAGIAEAYSVLQARRRLKRSS
jgi:hypothetical protein